MSALSRRGRGLITAILSARTGFLAGLVVGVFEVQWLARSLPTLSVT